MANRFISVLCIIALVFASSVLFTTEAKADYTVEYIWYDEVTGTILVSDAQIKLIGTSRTNATAIGILGANHYLASLKYSEDLLSWVTGYVKTTVSGTKMYGYQDNTSDTYSAMATEFNYLNVGNCKVHSNCNWSSLQKSYVVSYDDDLSSLPAGLTETEVNRIIDEQINSTTGTTTTVNTIENNITNVYNKYESGNITYETLQQNVTVYINQLNDLTDNGGNTLADLMAINNGLTYAQTVQDAANNAELVDQLTVSSNVSAQVTGMINQANTAFTKYNNKEVNQQDTVTVLNQYITNLTNLIKKDTPTADIEAINAGINTINGIRDSVTGNSDVNHDISESAQAHDKEEKEYLEDLTGETTSTIQDMSAEDQFQEQQRTEANNILALIWDNEILKRLVPISAVFMVVCVVLGIRYKL